jgi:hypothetical protein
MGGNDLLKSPRKDRGSIKRTLPAKSKGMLPLLWRLEFGYGAGLDGVKILRGATLMVPSLSFK